MSRNRVSRDRSALSEDSRVLNHVRSLQSDQEEGELVDDEVSEEEELRRRALHTIPSPQSVRSSYSRHRYLRGFYDNVPRDRSRSPAGRRSGASVDRRGNSPPRRRDESAERRRREDSLARRRELSLERRRREDSLARRREASVDRRRREDSLARRREVSVERRRREDSLIRRREVSVERHRREQSVERRRRENSDARRQILLERRRIDESVERHRREASAERRRKEELLDDRRRREQSLDRRQRGARASSQDGDPRRPLGGGSTSRGSKYSIPKELSLALTDWMSKGIPTADSKAIQELYKVDFDDESFSLNPPAIDDWQSVRIKRHVSRKAIEAEEKQWLALQFKVMDIATPLLNMYSIMIKGAKDKGSEHHVLAPPLKAALVQWARAFNHVTRRRRHNAAKAGTKALIHLLEKPEAYGSKEVLHSLFGKTFEDALVNHSNRQLTLSQAEAAETRAEAESAGPSRATRQQRTGTGRGFPGPAQEKDDAPGRGRGNWRGYVHCSSSLWSFVFPHFIKITRDPALVGGRLKYFAANWENLVSDNWIVDSISHGISLDFLSRPVQHSLSSTVAMSLEMRAVCDQEVADLLFKEAIREVTDGSDGFVSSLFVIPKKSGGFRPIVNLKGLNRFVRYEHFKMEGLQTVKALVRKGDWMVKLDLKDAYLTLPIHPAHQKFLRFAWKNRIYQFSCLPFGLGSAPRLFTKILKAVVAFFRERGLRVIIYLDDLLFLNEDREKLQAELKFAIFVLEALGFLINWAKSVISPSQSLEYLGVVVDSLVLNFSLPLDKVSKIKSLCSKASVIPKVPLRDLASILGNLAWAIYSVPFAQAHYRSLQNFFIRQSKFHEGDLTVLCSLSDQARQDLVWWTSSLDIVNGKRFVSSDPDIIIYSDASLKGWGACSNGVTTRGPWTTADQKRHINELELLGAFYAIQCFARNSSKICIRIFLDNNTAVCYINKHGGTRSESLTVLAKAISDWCEARNNSLEAVYLPGKDNTVADRESRSESDSSDWKLSPNIFAKILACWPMDIDLFASAWNTQLPVFATWKPQPGCYALDAFSLYWGDRAGYLFPPFSLIAARCLAKIRREKALVVLVCPIWPSQPWFPLLLELACDMPRILPPSPRLLTSPFGAAHPLSGSTMLAAWRLSGDLCLGRACRQRWSTYSWPARARPRTLLTGQPGSTGVIGVWENISIPCRMI